MTTESQLADLEAKVAALSADLAEMKDKEALREGAILYARSIDRCDPETVVAIWHDDGVYEHFQTGVHTYASAEERARETSAERASLIKEKTLIVSNTAIELDGDVAYVESHGISYNTIEPEGKLVHYVRTLRWLDRWERRDGKTWKIAYKLCLHDGFERFEPAAPSPFISQFYKDGFSKRGREDFVFQMKDRLRIEAAQFGR